MVQFLEYEGQQLAYRKLHFHNQTRFGVLFLGGFRSNMHGTKATALYQWAKSNRINYVCFDYFAHGMSPGDVVDGTISQWVQDASLVLRKVCEGPQIIVGSSMGGWIGSRLLELNPTHIMGFIGIASGPDFTRRIWERELTPEARQQILTEGIYYLPSGYDMDYPITKALIEDSKQHWLLHKRINFAGPVRLLHGLQDDVVPWQTSLDLADVLQGPDVIIELIKDGDHSLSRPQDLRLLFNHLEKLIYP